MKTIMPGLALAAGLLCTPAPEARAAIEEGYVPGGAPVPSTWYRRADPAAMAADRAYVAGMRRHHAGALTMSEDYLAGTGGSPALRQLALAIIRNQRFEIALLDDVARRLDQPPLRLGGLALQPMATEGLAQMARFQRMPLPGLAETPGGTAVTERDVRFAKAMILHHQGALDMVRDYRAAGSPRLGATNGFLGLLNVDIVTDQTQEIALMRRIVAAWPGDAAAVPVPPGMVHGMGPDAAAPEEPDGHGHGAGHGSAMHH